MIHCEPVLYDVYKGKSIAEHQQLGKMILHALDNGRACDRTLAVKNFFLFDNLFLINGTETHREVVHKVQKELRSGRNPDVLVEDINQGSLSPYQWEDKPAYCRKAQHEIQALISGTPRCRGRCKEIDSGEIEKKIAAANAALEENETMINRFIQQAGTCGGFSVSNSAKVKKVKNSSLNLRRNSTTKSDIVKELPRGTLLLVMNEVNGWYQVIDNKCSAGWVAGYLTRNARLR